MSNPTSTDGIAERFNMLNWHDSELRGIMFNYLGLSPRYAEGCELILRVNMSVRRLLSEPETFTPTKITFLNARFFHSDIDLLGVTCCGGDISCAECKADSAFMREFAASRVRDFNLFRQDDKSLARLKHFGIYLCNPSGEINIVAEDFEQSTVER